MTLPANVTVSTHPCLLAKLSKLRSASTASKETKSLVHEISLLLASQALAKVLTASTVTSDDGTIQTDVSPLGAPFNIHTVSPQRVVLVPVLRSGLAMVEGTPLIPMYPINNINVPTRS
jgi:uracil phosphoribosyltransferase